MSKTNGRKAESYSRIKDENGILVLREEKVERIWKEYFEDPYTKDNLKHVPVHICDFDGVQRGNYS